MRRHPWTRPPSQAVGESTPAAKGAVPTILVVPLGRLAAGPEPGSAMLSRLAVQYRGKVD
jgi:hypothetical protein